MKASCWWAVLSVGLMVTGCVNPEDDYYYDYGLPDAPGNDQCARGCNVLNACGYCEVDQQGYCLQPYECADQCRAFGAQRVYGCLASLRQCDQLQIQACYDGDFRPSPDDPPAPGDDGCANGCNALRACDFCVIEDGQCLPPVECAIECRANEQQAEYQCLQDQRMCSDDLVDICFSDEPPTPVETPCQAGCRGLDECDLCWPDDDGDCLDRAGCAAACEAGGTPIECYGELESCDDEAIDACLDPAPSCEALCAIFDEGGCAGCLTANRACVETAVCVAQCEEDPALAACLAGVDACADEAVLECPGVAVPQRDDMGVADMGAGDMGVADMGTPDLDMGAPDMSPPDMAPVDDAAVDAEPEDAAPEDAMPVDAALPDCAEACALAVECMPCLPDESGEACLGAVACTMRCVTSQDRVRCAQTLASCDPTYGAACQ